MSIRHKAAILNCKEKCNRKSEKVKHSTNYPNPLHEHISLIFFFHTLDERQVTLDHLFNENFSVP